MDLMFCCPTCNALHDEPLEAVLGLVALCFTCAVDAEAAKTDGLFAEMPRVELPIAA